jgi:hypothetical protein
MPLTYFFYSGGLERVVRKFINLLLRSRRMKILDKRLAKATSIFVKEMRSRLAKKERDGYTGWDGKHPTTDLIKQAISDLDVLSTGMGLNMPKLCIDIANRCMMVHFRLTHAAKNTKEGL